MAQNQQNKANVKKSNNLKAQRFNARITSAPMHQYTKKKNGSQDNTEQKDQIEHSSAFPRTFQHCGYLDVRTKPDKPWKRRYFVVNNNFLLSAATPHAKKLEQVIPLEGSNIKSSTKTSDMNFELFVGKHRLFFRAGAPTQCNIWTTAIQKASKLKVKDIYRFLYTLGTSGLTKVVAAKHRTSNQESAIKIIDKRTCNKKMLKTEIQILKKLENQYIVQLYDIIETKKYLYIVMEKCDGGELFDQIAELDGDHYTPEDCCHIMHQICKGVKYMHRMGIVHRDLKPENILCCYKNSIRKVKLADFGISSMKNMSSMSTVVGTISYTAPEVLQKKNYDYTVDYWSVGVIMFILLCGYPPFYGEDEQEVTKSILSDSLDFIDDDEDWDHVDNTIKNLVKGLLHKNPSQRKSIDDVLRAAWVLTSKSGSYMKSRKNFKKTILKRKFIRHSLSAFEKDSTLSKKLWNNKNKLKSKDTLTGNQQDNDLLSANKYQKRVQAFRGNFRRSKGTEELLELNLPLNKRESIFAIQEEENEN